ncbi:APC family permease [Streptomyces sp. RPA4-5]|uniref:APC family permease n=1 Tax=Streptomyces TaxID=1883 RepID=UPI00143E4AD7|nr:MULTISPECIES: APC family permease [Streptomyces]MCX4635796.1 APC family permease [Streptomyces platensis]QIY58881.1 APC family permease [Streptomyces sp. RPA4-5]WJY42163.1 APC family permease [Streptomyces sp. P9-2B-2]
MDMSAGERKGLSLFALIMIGIGSIFGSGWLFGAGSAAQVAGPAALVAWVIGVIFIGMIAMSYAEVGSAYPIPGGMARYGHLSHGPVLGFLTGWAVWIATASLIPIESIAATQYMTSWSFDWAKGLVDPATHQLTLSGTAVSLILTLALWLTCFWSVQLLARANTVLTLVKFAIPVLAVLALVGSGFHTSNFTDHGGFAPYGWPAVLTAVTTCGVVFAFNGFQAVVNLGGAAKNPGRAIPVALIGALALGLVIYTALQVAYLGSVPPELLERSGGWQGVNLNSPFADLAGLLMLHWVVTMLQFGAFISPAGSNIANVASAAYMVTNLAETGFFPRKLAAVHPRYGTARPAMWLNLAFSVVLLLTVGRSWQALAGVVSAAMVISYLIGPIAVGVLRRTRPELPRPFRLPAARVLCPVTFAFAACALYWSKWPETGKITVLTLVAAPVAAVVLWRRGERQLLRQFAPAWWMIAFLVWTAAVSALGGEEFGGRGVLPGVLGTALIAVTAPVFYFWAVRSGVKAHERGLTSDPTPAEADPASAVTPDDARPMASV